MKSTLKRPVFILVIFLVSVSCMANNPITESNYLVIAQ